MQWRRLTADPVAFTVGPGEGDDDTERIQAAIDQVEKLVSRSADGVRGAVLLAKGTYHCNRPLRVGPGVTLRGEGQDPGGTTVIATMIPPDGQMPTLIQVTGNGVISAEAKPHEILDETVPLGAMKLHVVRAAELKPGDEVIIERRATQNWIHDLKMDVINLHPGGVQWKAEDYCLKWSCRIADINGDVATLDTPVICSIEQRYGGGEVCKAVDQRGRGASVENLRLESVYQKGKEGADERHAWTAILISGIVDSWVRNVTAVHFAYSCVQVDKNASRITVQDCAMIDPVSEITGGRRYSFVGGGQFVLFQRCYARNGRHDFVTGQLDVGPTVFLDCLAEHTHSDIGPHHRWSCGQLYDNVRGGQINVQDRGGMGTGHGWAGNCQVLWNCEAKTFICEKPWIISAQNWAVGCVGQKGSPALAGRPEGFWESYGQHVAPRSLYLSQLAARIAQAGGNPDQAIRAVTIPEQRKGVIWGLLHERYQNEKLTDATVLSTARKVDGKEKL